MHYFKCSSPTLKRIFVQNFHQLDNVVFWRKEPVDNFWSNQFEHEFVDSLRRQLTKW